MITCGRRGVMGECGLFPGHVGQCDNGGPIPVDAPAPAPAPDLVNHPPHYTSHPSGVECVTIAEHFGFNLGSALKYLWRAGLKGDAIEDLRKARWYLDREIARRNGAGGTT